MSDSVGYLNVPSNIKQYYLPFVLDPNNALNKEMCDFGKDISNGYTQVFSFRPGAFLYENQTSFATIDEKHNFMDPAAGFLRIAPHDLYRCYDKKNENNEFYSNRSVIDNDMSFKMLYNYQFLDNDTSKIEKMVSSTSINTAMLLNFIPTITIREYLQESKLNTVTNFLKNSFSALQDGFAAGSKLAESLKNSEDKAKIIKLAFEKFNFTEALVEKFGKIIEDISEKLAGYLTDFSLKGNKENLSDGEKHVYNSIMQFPYAIYYLIISSATMNIYEVPFSGKTLYTSQGGGFSKDPFGGVGSKGESLLGLAINWFGKHLTVNINPTWDGPQDTPTKVEVEFDLYNDSIDGALKNFIFINTIVPGNKWVQYNVFQHAPNLYDVKINGIDRLFMCTADFNVEYVGQLRKPSANFISTLVSLHSFCNKDGKYFSSGDNIRIPDQYKVKITFTSLLPNNFNNFLYSYWYNTPIKQLENKKIYLTSIAGDFMDKALKAMQEIADDFLTKVDEAKNEIDKQKPKLSQENSSSNNANR